VTDPTGSVEKSDLIEKKERMASAADPVGSAERSDG
jgi:hypothetical protein